MRFSIFEDDNTLGLDNARVVVLRGSTTVNRLFNSSAFPIDSWIRTALVNAGFDVVAVRYSWQSSLPFGGNGVNVEIEINVYNNFTSEQARVNAITAIEAYTANLGLNKPFYNTTLSVAYDAYVPPGQTGSGGTRPRVVPPASPPSTYDQSGVPNSGSQFFGNLGYALGISTPMAVLLALGVGLVILKR